eukprot:CAMPEP_0116059822 /NCGR_PEP_ID=MMETSP0322-20121206/6035_1 /TAXON_ID=163516 /ORGANISM="Leptocylindrus danicus var. apora, Strain B651" /LENGTH=418 /DNA_ID=CAMNT_0003544297 /DNA_START=45 /DNA_END=1301 /DNA_ORIENTATION=+
MGKKPKSAAGKNKALARKFVPEFAKAVPKVEEQVGSFVPKEDPGLPGDNYKVLDGEGYDDGGVADLTLMLDLDDMVWRRKRGDKAYYEAIRNDLLPRQTVGSMAKYSRRDQKVQLAQVLFGDDPDSSHTEEIYSPPLKGDEDPAVIKQITKNLATAKEALKLSIILEEPACMAMSLVEIAKRILTLKDKEGADDAIRCLEKAIEISSDGFWDLDEIKDETIPNPTARPKDQKNATKPGLANPASLKLMPIRVSHLCLRSTWLNMGNAWAAKGDEAKSREYYEKIFPLLSEEPRCQRIDGERHALFINIGNTYVRNGDFTLADEQYKLAEKLGQEHVDAKVGSEDDGMAMVIGAWRARSKALMKVGREDEAKTLMREVIQSQIKLNAINEEKKAKAEAAAIEAQKKQALAVEAEKKAEA